MHLWFARFGSKDLNKSENLRLFSFVLGESKNLRAWALAFFIKALFGFWILGGSSRILGLLARDFGLRGAVA